MRVNAKRQNGKRRGAVLVEAALVIPIAFAIILGLLEYGRLVLIRQLVDNAAREGARLAVVSTSTLTTQDIQNCVTTRMSGLTLQGIAIQVYKADPTTGANVGVWTDAALGDCIAVQVNGNFTPIVPGISLLPNPLAMSTKVMMQSEAN
jgi:Flp pilus assembly protein TadG